MPPKVPIISKQYLQDVPLPTHGGKYAVLSHGSIMQYIEDKLAQNGLIIEDTVFRAAQYGQIVTGTYHIINDQDNEIGLMVSFNNSYNKMVRFGCTVGGYNKFYKNYYIARNVATWNRKHTGTIDAEAIQHINDQIDMIAAYYNNIVKSRTILSNCPIIPQFRAAILGYLYFEKGLMTIDQASQLKRNLTSALLDYPCDNLWELYNHVTMVLKSSHPKDWIDHQGKVHDIILYYASTVAPKINNDDEGLPGQLGMFDEPDHLGAVVTEGGEAMANIADKTIVMERTTSESDDIDVLNTGFINSPNTFVAPEPESYDLD